MESFTHKISKGSRFSQIYIPQHLKEVFEPGDTVKVVLVKKRHEIYYSKSLAKLNELKESIARQLIIFLSRFTEIKQVFLVGSFLTKSDYRDIDILIITKTDNKDFETELSLALIDKLKINIHLISMSEYNFTNLVKICPLTRSMLYYFVSNKKFALPSETQLNKDHIRFLLMMPQDLLRIKVNSRNYYDNIRRLVTIQRFLENKNIDPLKIDSKLSELLDSALVAYLKNNEPINSKILKDIREILKMLIQNINRKIKNGKK